MPASRPSTADDRRYDAILFDFDGVLADTEPLHWACWAAVLEPLGIHLTWEFYRNHAVGSTDRALVEKLAPLAAPGLSVDRLYEQYPAKQRLFRERVAAAPPIPAAVLEFLLELRDYRLAVVTSSQLSEVEPALEAAGIRACFGAVVGAGDVARHKPAPDAYLLAAQRLGAARPLVVEDSDAGLAAARAAGFDVVRVSGAGETPDRVREALARSGIRS
ncbi:MAG: HAD family phosphatase [Bryobacteraceae bacterium]|jgi:beta-phosphoglucomutase